MTDVTMRQLLEAGAHFGHQTRFWSPKMRPYIYGHRNKIHIINLEQTYSMFNDALNYLGGIAAKRGTVMFVGTKRQAGEIVREQGQRANCPYVYHRWLGGMLTNYRTVRKSIDRLRDLEDTMRSEGFSRISKKEAMQITREHFRLDRNLSGIRDMQGLPDALFVIDVRHEYIAVQEARKLGIPVVAVVDTNCDPDGVDYVIPGNDDAISSIRLFCTAAAEAVIAGQTLADASAPYQGNSEPLPPGDEVSSTLSITSARASVAPSWEGDDESQQTADPAQPGEVAQPPSEDAESSETPQAAIEESSADDDSTIVTEEVAETPQDETTDANASENVEGSNDDPVDEPSQEAVTNDESASEQAQGDDEVSASADDSSESNGQSTTDTDNSDESQAKP